MFFNKYFINKLIKVFEKLIKYTFKYWKVLSILFFSCLKEVLVLYFTNSLYLVKNIKIVLKEVFSTERSILDFLYITSVRTRIRLLVITI